MAFAHIPLFREQVPMFLGELGSFTYSINLFLFECRESDDDSFWLHALEFVEIDMADSFCAIALCLYRFWCFLQTWPTSSHTNREWTFGLLFIRERWVGPLLDVLPSFFRRFGFPNVAKHVSWTHVPRNTSLGLRLTPMLSIRDSLGRVDLLALL